MDDNKSMAEASAAIAEAGKVIERLVAWNTTLTNMVVARNNLLDELRRELQAEREKARFCFGCGKEFDEMAAK